MDSATGLEPHIHFANTFLHPTMSHNAAESKKSKVKGKENSKTRKIKQKTRPVSFAEEPHKDSNDDKEKSPKASNKKDVDEKPKSDSRGKFKERKPIAEIEADAIPDVAPDPGLSTRTTYYATSLSASSTHSGLIPLQTHSSGSTPVATVLGVAASSTLSSVFPSPTSPAINAASSSDNSHDSKHPSTVVIVVLSIVAAFVLFGLVGACWVYSRPKKRTTPTPSLPILQEDYPEEKPTGDEESLFGGKERVSAQPGTGTVLYNWTPYPHTSVIQPKATSDPAVKRMSTRQSTFLDEKSSYLFKGQGVVANPPPSSPPLQQLHNAVSRAVNRVSAMSASIYPVSPQPSHNYSGIGVAIGGDNSPQTAEYMPMLHRNVSKSSARRQSKVPTRPARQSIAGFDMLTGPVNNNDISAPVLPPPASSLPASSSGGRARVQGPYTSTVSMRTSTSAGGGFASSRFSVSDRGGNPFESSQYVLPPLPPVSKTYDSRERDTKALTSALGLETPPMPVSPATLYPDDSITLAGDRRRSRAFSHSRMRSQALSPTVDATARLGNLMLENFQSSLSLNPSSQPPTHNLPPLPKPAIKKRTEDKPPRVPSPPPMPSLAQMAMEHANPGDFADYRSPTYSIYGFYETDRKSTDRKSKSGLRY